MTAEPLDVEDAKLVVLARSAMALTAPNVYSWRKSTRKVALSTRSAGTGQ